MLEKLLTRYELHIIGISCDVVQCAVTINGNEGECIVNTKSWIHCHPYVTVTRTLAIEGSTRISPETYHTIKNHTVELTDAERHALGIMPVALDIDY